MPEILPGPAASLLFTKRDAFLILSKEKDIVSIKFVPDLLSKDGILQLRLSLVKILAK